MLTMIGTGVGMPSLSLSGKLIWFAHCPKAGGTSVEQFMVARWGDAVGHLHWGWDIWWRQGGWRLADPPNSPQHLVWKDAAAALPRMPDSVFAVVRDPASRLASEYRWQRQGRRGTLLGKALAHLPFSLWLRVMLATAARYPHAFDNHLRPQTDFIPGNARVFRLEEGLDQVATWLTETAGSRPEDRGIPHAIPTRLARPIAARDLAIIGRAFAADYARFGYPRPVPPPARQDLGEVLAAGAAFLVAALDKRGLL